MTILMYAEDPAIAVENSSVRARMRAYASLFDALHVIVPAARPKPQCRERNLFIYFAYHRNSFLRKMKFYTIAKTLAQNIHFDVMTVQGPDEVGVLGFFVSRKFHIPLQIQVHTDVLSPWYRYASWREYIRYCIAGFLLPRASCIRVVSARIARSLEKELGIESSRIAILPIASDLTPFFHGVKNSYIEERLRPHRFRMVAAGRFVEKEKNFSMLIRMMPQFLKIAPDAALYLVGDGPDRGLYQNSISHLHLERNVIIEPWREDLFSVYQSCDLFLLSSNYEGWGMAVVEAMAAGMPVVMTDVGLAGEVVRHGENGIVVPVGDEKAFLNAIADMYANSEKRIRIAHNALHTMQEFVRENHKTYLQKYKESFMICGNVNRRFPYQIKNQ